MKYTLLSLAMASLLAVPAALAAQAPRTAQQTSSTQSGHSGGTTAARSEPGQSHVVNAEFVSYDAKTKAITTKDNKGQTSTAPLQGAALREMSSMHLKAGDHVTLTYRDDAKGGHQAITDIRLSKAGA